MPAVLSSARGCEHAPAFAGVNSAILPFHHHPELPNIPAETVIIGLGNEIARDDAVGILAARRLQKELGGRAELAVKELPWAGFHLLEAIQGYRRAILIDSLCSDQHPPGKVVRLSERQFAGSVRLNSFHDLNYPTAMALGRALGWSLPEQVDIYAVVGEAFAEFGTSLTPAVAAGLEEVVRLVSQSVADGAEAPAAASG